MTPREIRTAGWVNKRRSGQRRGYCDRGLRSMEFPGRCTRIGRTSISGSPQKESDCKEGVHDAVRTHVRAAGDPHHRGKFTASERSRGAKQRGKSRPPGKEAE